MSMEVFKWAKEQHPHTPLEKLVLMLLADMHNGATGLCFPSIATLAKAACASDRGVRNAVHSLIKQSLISVNYRSGRSAQFWFHVAQTSALSAEVATTEPRHSVPTTPALCAEVTDTDPGTLCLPPRHSVPTTPAMCSGTPALSADELGSNKESNWEGNLERARALEQEYTRRPPDDFKPDEKFFALVKHRNQLSDLDTQIALFCNHEFKTGATDWQSRWAQWWIRAASYERQPALSVSPEVRAKYSPATIRSAQNLKEWANG